MSEILEQAVCKGSTVVDGEAAGEVLAGTTELGFRGGVDPETGAVIDRHHPLHGQRLADRIPVIPGGRGPIVECTALITGGTYEGRLDPPSPDLYRVEYDPEHWRSLAPGSATGVRIRMASRVDAGHPDRPDAE